MRTIVHLVRHAEVYNPGNVWYGRLEGFHLSERGLRQAASLAEFFAARPVSSVYCSPLQRAIETATPIAQARSLEVQIDEALIESMTKLQGGPADKRIFRNPLNLRYFINPFRPTWGEPYASTSERMVGAINRMRELHLGGEVVAVSHMTPVLVARLAIEGNRKPPWRAGLPCRRGSVTSLEFEDDRYVSTRYEPVGSAIA